MSRAPALCGLEAPPNRGQLLRCLSLRFPLRASGRERQGSGDGRGRKRRRDASGQEREVRVAGLGHVVVRARAGEPLRLRDVVGGRCWKAARVPHFVHAHGNDSTDFAGLGGGSADAGGGLEAGTVF